ncbi:hypothetical protein ACHAXN_003712 [Cyclotella atomus]
MIIPIFKNLQRSMAGMAAAGRLRPAIGITTQDQLFNNGEASSSKQEHENETIQLPDGYNLSKKQDNNEVDLHNPSTWPINSEEARSIRKQFIADGFRRLHARGGGSRGAIANDVLLLQSQHSVFDLQDSGIEADGNEGESALALAVRELGERLFERQVEIVDEGQVVMEESGEQSDDSVLILTEENDDWMYLPQ